MAPRWATSLYTRYLIFGPPKGLELLTRLVKSTPERGATGAATSAAAAAAPASAAVAAPMKVKAAMATKAENYTLTLGYALPQELVANTIPSFFILRVGAVVVVKSSREFAGQTRANEPILYLFVIPKQSINSGVVSDVHAPPRHEKFHFIGSVNHNVD
ncbi:hypothetical protein AX15_002247 [Amanita polypyramis BW_CC]|nr:hypothetical protein AX15_002247 [Amanita polypyramis BW_CC]